MKIAVFSDLHIESGDYDPGKIDADVIVLAGDTHTKTRAAIWAGNAFPDQPVVMIAGNHEFWGGNIDYETDRLKASAPSNVHVLDDDAVIIGGVRFVGSTLWTDYNLFGTRPISVLAATNKEEGMNDFKKIKEGPSYKRLSVGSISRKHGASKSFLKKQLKDTEIPTVVITHHLPSELSISEGHRHDKHAPAYASRLSDLVMDSGAKLWVHGHTHNTMDYMLGDTRVVCNPKGYRFQENLDFDPDFSVTIHNEPSNEPRI